MLRGSIDGGTGSSTIVGPNSAATTTWMISGPNAGQASFITGTFSNIGALTGGSGPNTYTFTGDGSLSGTLVGGSGTNSSNEIVSTGNVNDTWNVTGVDSGDVPLIGGGFTNIGSLDVGGGTDSVILTPPGQLTGFVQGEGDDTLEGDGSTWTITGKNRGTVAPDVLGGFDGFGNLKGFKEKNLNGSEVGDTFIFMPGGFLTGSINGGGTATLDFSNYTLAPTVKLTGLGASHGYAGTATAIGKGFTNIDTLIGSSSKGGGLAGMGSPNSLWIMNPTDIFQYLQHKQWP